MGYEDVSHTQHALKQLQSVTQEVVDGDVALVAATGTLTITDTQNAVADETVVIDGVTYTFVAAASAAYEVTIGADDEGSCANLAAAINAGAGEGTAYGTNTNAHPTVTAAQSTNTCVVTAIKKGDSQNALATTETMTQGTWGGATLAGGDGEVAVTGITTTDAIESILPVDGTSGVPEADVTAEASIPVNGKIGVSTTDLSGKKLVVRWLPDAASLK